MYLFASKRMQFLQNGGSPLVNGYCTIFSKRFDVVSLQCKNGSIVFQRQEPKTSERTNTSTRRLDIYYIKIDWIGQFVKNILPTLQEPIVLITACSDYTPKHCFPRETEILLQSSRIYKWWAQNNDIIGNDKVKSLPYGLAHCQSLENDGWECIERETFLLTLRAAAAEKTKHPRIFCCWRKRSQNVAGADKVERERATDWVQSDAGNKICDLITHELDGRRYLELVAEYAYILCPNGNGIDPCPRVWEALILGTVPIIKSSTMDDAYTRLPCLIVRDWNEVTPDLLQQKGSELIEEVKKDTMLQKLTLDYWEQLIRSSAS